VGIDNQIHFYSLQLDAGNKQNAIREQNILDLKEEIKLLNEELKELSESNQKNIQKKKIDDHSKKKNVSSAE